MVRGAGDDLLDARQPPVVTGRHQGDLPGPDLVDVAELDQHGVGPDIAEPHAERRDRRARLGQRVPNGDRQGGGAGGVAVQAERAGPDRGHRAVHGHDLAERARRTAWSTIAASSSSTAPRRRRLTSVPSGS